MDQITTAIASIFVSQDPEHNLIVDPNAPATGSFDPTVIRAMFVKQADGTVYSHVDQSQNGQQVFNQTNIQYPNGQTINSNDGQTQTSPNPPQPNQAYQNVPSNVQNPQNSSSNFPPNQQNFDQNRSQICSNQPQNITPNCPPNGQNFSNQTQSFGVNQNFQGSNDSQAQNFQPGQPQGQFNNQFNQQGQNQLENPACPPNNNFNPNQQSTNPQDHPEWNWRPPQQQDGNLGGQGLPNIQPQFQQQDPSFNSNQQMNRGQPQRDFPNQQNLPQQFQGGPCPPQQFPPNAQFPGQPQNQFQQNQCPPPGQPINPQGMPLNSNFSQQFPSQPGFPQQIGPNFPPTAQLQNQQGQPGDQQQFGNQPQQNPGFLPGQQTPQNPQQIFRNPNIQQQCQQFLPNTTGQMTGNQIVEIIEVIEVIQGQPGVPGNPGNQNQQFPLQGGQQFQGQNFQNQQCPPNLQPQGSYNQ